MFKSDTFKAPTVNFISELNYKGRADIDPEIVQQNLKDQKEKKRGAESINSHGGFDRKLSSGCIKKN